MNNLHDWARTKHGDWKVFKSKHVIMIMHDNFDHILSIELTSFFFASKCFSVSFVPRWSNTLTGIRKYKITEHTQTNRQHTIIEHPQTNTHHTHRSTIYTERHTQSAPRDKHTQRVPTMGSPSKWKNIQKWVIEKNAFALCTNCLIGSVGSWPFNQVC